MEFKFGLVTYNEEHACAFLDGTAASEETDDEDDDSACNQEVACAQVGEAGEDLGEVAVDDVDVDADREHNNTGDL